MSQPTEKPSTNERIRIAGLSRGSVIGVVIGLGAILVEGTALAVLIVGLIVLGICVAGLVALRGKSGLLKVATAVGIAIALPSAGGVAWAMLSPSGNTSADPEVSQPPNPAPDGPPISSGLTATPSITASPTDSASLSGSPTTEPPSPIAGLFKVGLGALCHAPGAKVYICGTEYRDTIPVGKATRHFDERFDSLRDELKGEIDQVCSIVDGIAKDLTDDRAERAAITVQQHRQAEWIKQLAKVPGATFSQNPERRATSAKAGT
jgi:hypothetical protein